METKKNSPLSMSIDIACTSKAILQHVQDVDAGDHIKAFEEFCGSNMVRAQMFVSPMLLGLSLELALKAWAVLDGSKTIPPKGHDLPKLFALTSDATQKRLKLSYKEQVAPLHLDLFRLNYGLEDFLNEVSHAFVEWRYSHEVERARIDGARMSATAEVLLSEFESCIVVEKHPDSTISQPE